MIVRKFTALLCFIVPLLSLSAASALPAFPGVQGYGSDSFGGSGRNRSKPSAKILRVTNLKDSGSGSLRSCVEASGPRVCIFEVSGPIDLRKALKIGNPYLTIAGQTAPFPGVELRHGSLRIQTHDVVVQHIRVRVGEQNPNWQAYPDRDGIQIYETGSDTYRVVVDHVSVYWAVDESISTCCNKVRDITFSNMIVAQSLFDPGKDEGPGGYAMLFGDGTSNISVHNSLLALNPSRNPKFRSGNSGEFVNNVVYGWNNSISHTSNFSDSHNTKRPQMLNFVGNYYKAGPMSSKSETIFANGFLNLNSRVYLKGNLGPRRPKLSQSEWRIMGYLPSSPYRINRPAVESKVEAIGALLAYKNVLANAGARPAERDAVDKELIRNVKNGGGEYVNCIKNDGRANCSKNVGGWPAMQKNSRKLTTPEDPFGDKDGDGYTNLENWLHLFSRGVESPNDPIAPLPPGNFRVAPLNLS